MVIANIAKIDIVIVSLFFGVMSAFGQVKSSYSDSAKIAEFREKIGLDMSVSDFETKKINAMVMVERNASLINFLMENYHQAFYGQQIARVLREQNEEVGMGYVEIKKMKFLHASMSGNAMTFLFKVWLVVNTTDDRLAKMKLLFNDGISESKTVDELLSYMSRYVKA